MTLGERLEKAFRESLGMEDKKSIAEILGFKTDKSVYRVIRGERELNFSALLRFRNSTKRSLDWLITGEGPEDIRELQERSLEDLFLQLLTRLDELPTTNRHSTALKLIHKLSATTNSASEASEENTQAAPQYHGPHREATTHRKGSRRSS